MKFPKATQDKLREARLRGPQARMAARNRYRKRTYGIGSDEYEAQLARQGGRCAICRTEDPKGPVGEFVIDHDHETGRIRGLLCNKCNTGLGMFNDSIEALAGAIEYLADPPAPADLTR